MRQEMLGIEGEVEEFRAHDELFGSENQNSERSVFDVAKTKPEREKARQAKVWERTGFGRIWMGSPGRSKAAEFYNRIYLIISPFFPHPLPPLSSSLPPMLSTST